MSDMFTNKNITPMLLAEIKEPFDDERYIFELKLDGIRCLIYLDKTSTTIRNKRNKDVTSIYPELGQLYKSVSAPCILDGELIFVKDGKPDFFTMQGRSLMSHSFTIQLQAKLHPISFVAFDILYLNGLDLTKKPLLERKKILEETVTETDRISISRFISTLGKKFFALAKKNELEGVVAKLKDSEYYVSTRTKEWIKMKVLQEEDLIICGYRLTNNQIKDIVFGFYNEYNQLTFRTQKTFALSKPEQQLLLKAKKTNAYFPIENVIWIEPKYTGVIAYMQKTKSGGMRQPFFRGIKND